MKLKRIKLKNKDVHSLCVLKEDQWLCVKSLFESVPDDGSEERVELENVSDDLIGFLKRRKYLEPKLNEMIGVALENGAALNPEGYDVIPFKPLQYRDFMLSEKHVINSSRGFVKRLMPAMWPIVKTFEKICGKPFPMLKPKTDWYENPIYYKGNAMSFVTNGELIKFPEYATLKDYELELGMIITKDIMNADQVEGLDAIGAFCVFNDFSARNVQLDEMKKTGFGPCKSKDFANAISTVVVTADEIIPVMNEIKARVVINGKLVAQGQLNEFYHSLGSAVAYASKGEKVYAGEFMGSGTIPNCCGMENSYLLNSGDTISVEIDRIGTLINTVE